MPLEQGQNIYSLQNSLKPGWEDWKSKERLLGALNVWKKKSGKITGDGTHRRDIHSSLLEAEISEHNLYQPAWNKLTRATQG